MSGLTFVLRLLDRPVRGRDLRIATGPCVIRPATWWVYLVGPVAGAVIAVGVAHVLRGPAKVQEAGAAVGTPLDWAHEHACSGRTSRTSCLGRIRTVRVGLVIPCYIDMFRYPGTGPEPTDPAARSGRPLRGDGCLCPAKQIVYALLDSPIGPATSTRPAGADHPPPGKSPRCSRPRSGRRSTAALTTAGRSRSQHHA